MNFITQLRTEIGALETERNSLLDELNVLGTDDGVERSADENTARAAEITARADEITARGKELQGDIDSKTERLTELVALEEARTKTVPNFIRPTSPAAVADIRNMDAAQLTDVLARSYESNDIDDTSMRSLVKRHRGDGEWLRSIAARSTDVYTSAFAKLMTGRDMFMSDEERAAIAVGTSAQGGYLVPTHLDPTMILTNAGTANVIRSLARQVTLTRENTWNGVTTAGSTFSWDAELAQVSDDSPNDLGNPSIPTYVGAGFIQASYQAFEDIENLASDVSMLLADGRDRLEAVAHATGSGSGEPTGIFTALDANVAVEIVSTTAATIGLVDLQLLKRSVPVRHRGMGTFLMNPVWADATKPLDTNVYVNVGNHDMLLSRPLVECDEAPSTVTTTVKDNEIVYGDFSRYVIVDKPGSSTLDYIPNLMGADGRPIGARGWYMRFRSGADSVNDLAFRLLQDKTSA